MTVEDTIILSFQDLISKHIKYHIVEDIPTKTFLKFSKHRILQQLKIKKGREGWIHTLLPMYQGCSETDHTSNKYFFLIHHLPVQYTLSAISPFLHTFKSQSLHLQLCDMFLNIFVLSVV